LISQGDENIGLKKFLGPIETFRSDPDNLVWPLVNPDLLANNVRISAMAARRLAQEGVGAEVETTVSN